MLRELAEWGRGCGLSFNAEKTVAVLFTRKKKEPTHFIHFEGKILPYSTEVKYLGVELDSKLHWKTHIKNKLDKAKKLIMKISHITRASFGPSPNLMRWAFTGIVRPLITYGSLVWAHELNNVFIVERMRKLDRLAINTFCVIARSTPTRLLEVMLDVMPLDSFCRYTVVNTYFCIFPQLEFGWSGEYNNVHYSVSHLKYWEK